MSWQPRLRSFSGILLALVVGCTGPDLQVDEARVRALIPGDDKTVGYFTIVNRSERTLTLVGATSDSARAIELHTTQSNAEGIMRMRRLKDLRIESGETLSFGPGGHHLMVFGVGDLGEEVKISLNFVERDPLLVTFDVVGLLD